MAKVMISGNLRQFTDGQSEFEIEARDIRGLFRELTQRYPSVAPHLETGIAVAINGEIFQDTLFEPIPEGAEVHLMPAIGGG
ncbi:MAG: molybdopterin synthase sulfur carrier subunit [Gammaproteobacteria bacterium]|nr:molybdopterin synthase sulfur carrier subunit [Gammaproteobacteria bacterium]|tara:strand:- start:849 stop:1094 length:246 start_codon:yes stop_codon:yes gene_type:complete